MKIADHETWKPQKLMLIFFSQNHENLVTRKYSSLGIILSIPWALFNMYALVWL